jgi:hypothetical protein
MPVGPQREAAEIHHIGNRSVKGRSVPSPSKQPAVKVLRLAFRMFAQSFDFSLQTQAGSSRQKYRVQPIGRGVLIDADL